MREARRTAKTHLPRLARTLVEAAVPARLHDAVVGDFEEQFAARRARSRSSAAVWLWQEVATCTTAWLRYWLTRPCSVRVTVAVLAGLSATAVGLLVVDLGPLRGLLAGQPAALRLPIFWSLEGALVVATAFLTARIGRAEARQAGCGLAAVLALVPLGRYLLSGDAVGISWLVLKVALVLTCVAIGCALAARPTGGSSTASAP